jgi:predicted anti-sigma-YlaC factor YlaD
MDCRAARELMSTADRAALEAASEAALAAHLAHCASCRASARAILDAERELVRALAAATPRRSLEEVGRTAASRPAQRRWLWRAVPVAAAAVVAALLLGRPAPVRWLPQGPTRFAHRAGIAVQAPPGRSVAVLRTDNPDIVVIWFF